MPVGDYVTPAEGGGSFERYDQGIDWKGPVGSNVVAIGGGILDRISYDAGGFGIASYYHLTEGPGKGTEIYVGHADPIDVAIGKPFPAGTPISRLLQTPHGNAPGDPGHTEVGIANPGGSGPAYSITSNEGGYAFAKLLNAWGIGNVGGGVNPFGSAVTGQENPNPTPTPGPGAPTPSNCANDNWSAGACGSTAAGSGNEGDPCCASGFGTSGDVTGTITNGQCCGAGIGAGGNQKPGSSSSGGCQCAHVHIPILGGFNLLPCFMCDFLDAVTSQAFWVRAGEIILGLILLVIGLRLAVGRGFASAPVQSAVKAAAVAA